MRLKPASDAVCTLLGRCFIDKVIRSFELTTDSSYSNDSVDCAVCHNTYHMYCVRPVLTKKPARGFAWACAACSRAQEKKLEARIIINNKLINLVHILQGLRQGNLLLPILFNFAAKLMLDEAEGKIQIIYHPGQKPLRAIYFSENTVFGLS